MEYVMIGLLVVVIILLIVNLFKKNNNIEITDRLSKLELSVVKEIGEFKVNFASDIRKDFDVLDEKVERKLTEINNRVTERLDQNLEKTNKTFANVLERLSKIDEAQKKIDGLGEDIVSLQSILTDKKTRGIFGEVNLQFILENAFGGTNTGIYDLQHKMSNGSIADAILYAPAPLGTIAIDSKFPLENYERMTNKNLSKEERLVAEKQFKIDFKKHIDAIASKYIIPGETSNEAILFLPALIALSTTSPIFFFINSICSATLFNANLRKAVPGAVAIEYEVAKKSKGFVAVKSTFFSSNSSDVIPNELP